MNKFAFILLLLLAGRYSFAQMPGGEPGRGGVLTGRLYGRVLDANGKGIDYATVLILKISADSGATKQKGTLLKGVNTESNGDFSAEDVPLNTPLKVSVSEIGFETLDIIVTLTGRASNRDLGNLKLVSASKELKGVVVSATKPYMTADMEKKVFDVSKDITGAGGNGLDLVKNVPSVNVDIDGNVTMRGGSPQLLVDGKPTTLTLDEIPADAIESIEVISNPSAKYDASGGGTGILNIVLKKNRKSGYNGNIHGGADNYGGVNGGAGINIRQNKVNFSADINARKMRDITTQSIGRTDLSSTPETYLDEQEHDTMTGSMFFSKFGLDYFVTNRTTLSLTGFLMHHGMQSAANINMDTDSLFSSGTRSQYSHEEINSSRSFNGRGATLGVKHLFTKEKESWTADANYFSGNAQNNAQYTTTTYGAAQAGTVLQKIAGGGNDHNIILQSDYSNPITPGTTLEAGVRAALQDRLNTNDNYTYSADQGAYVLIPSAASNYKSQSNVYAAYATIAGTTGLFSYKAGLRAESSDYSGTLLNSGQTFSNQYPISLFPSAFMSRKLGGDQELQLSYTRRVNRPNFFQLIPYTDSSNKLNITRGNPNLVPEFTQSLELTYLKSFGGKGTFIASAYYKYTDHLITGYIEQDANAAGGTTLVSTYINAASSYSAGGEVTGQFSFTRWWDMSANINVYHSAIDLGNSSIAYQQVPWSWFGKLNSTFRLPAGFSLQLSGMYQSKTNVPVNNNNNQPGPPNMQAQSAAQGYISPFYEVDVAAKKSFMANKLSVSLSFNDIFRSRVQDQYTYSDYFTQYYDRLKNPQMIRLNLAYNFGKMDASIFQRKNNNMQTDEQ